MTRLKHSTGNVFAIARDLQRMQAQCVAAVFLCPVNDTLHIVRTGGTTGTKRADAIIKRGRYICVGYYQNDVMTHQLLEDTAAAYREAEISGQT